MAAAFYVIGKGIRERNSPFRQAYVFGALLNAVDVTGWYSPLDIWDSATLFDLSTITKNHEVVVALVNVRTDGPYSLTFNFKWYRDRDSALLYKYIASTSASYAAEQSAFSYIGWVPHEINENGGYHVDISVTGTYTFNYTLNFTVSGIPAVITPPSPVTPFVDAIFSVVWDIKDYVYVAYTIVQGWVWPFSALSAPIYTLYVVINGLLTPIANFGEWVDDIATKIAAILTERGVIALLQTWLTYAEDAWDWISSALFNVWSIVDTWWSLTSFAVKGWLTVATEGLSTLIVAWGTFLKVTLPTLINSTGLDEWWQSRLQDIDTLLNSAFTTRAGLWSGWQEIRDQVVEFFNSPLDWLLDKFTDWFLGPEV